MSRLSQCASITLPARNPHGLHTIDAEDEMIDHGNTADVGQGQNITEAARSTASSDGGWQAWTYVLGGFLVFFNIWGFTFAFGAFQSYYALHLHPSHSASSISWIGTIQSFLLIIVGVISGPLFDLGYYKTMILAGSFLTIFGIMMLSLSIEYYQILLSQGICVGLGCGLLYVPSLALVSGSFTTKRAIAVGVATCGIAVGGIVYTTTFSQLIARVGFPWTVRIMGFIASGVFLLSFPCLLWKSPASNQRPPRAARQLIDFSAFRDPLFDAFAAIMFFTFLGYIVPYFYIPAFAEQALHTSPSLALTALVVSQVTSLFGRAIAASVAHHVGGMVPWFVCTAVSVLFCFCWTAMDSVGSFFVFCALYGLFSAALVALPASVLPLVCPNPEMLGTRMGMSWACSAVAFLIGTPIGAALTSADDRLSSPAAFRGVQLWSGAVLVVATALLVLLWFAVMKDKNRVFV
ncbi:uncharacterized protein Z518_07351 [Rhinocladiella mackenziei CBS 650.93]|uniref:Major facilitator superfamily (MFS) profile domain-containing protein n=1 Tax=Rhinocladiella mackenziei CBS 650.93 TaxID=1442369 RepID=A0A0D2H030_9EURO|nr:uncharacterized protein Z518_07351 [Rhinocladiella mackenziei CBS 650.93]KIX03798.1 hypothetical protein Z518_07351 [Rhinocladiella mackenziei CBS 650.93]